MTPDAQLEALTPALEHGWRLFPCAERAKVPLFKHWQRLASSDPEAIRSWTHRYLGCNWGLATGLESRLWVLDIDGQPGQESLAALVSQHESEWISTLRVETANGRHLYFSWPHELSVRNSARKLGAGLDTRGAGGYVIVPPSIHPTGAAYRWMTPLNSQPPRSAPEWLLKLVTSPQRPAVTAADIHALYVGQRNETLYRRGCYLRRKGWEWSAIESDLFEQNARRYRPPLPDADIVLIAKQASEYPVGGPDILQTCWQAIQQESFASNYEKFIGLARALQAARPGQTVALPTKRIGELYEPQLHRTEIGTFRKRAVREGILELAEPYIAQQKAACYRLREKTLPTLPTLSNGLVRVVHEERTVPIERIAVGSYRESAGSYRESARRLPACPDCGSYALYREKDGTVSCQTCNGAA